MITFFLLTSCLTLAPSRGVLFNWLPGMGYLNSSLISFYLLISLYFPHLHLPQTYSVRVISILNWSYIFLWVCFPTQSASRNKRMAPFSDCWACGVSSSERIKGKSLWAQSTDSVFCILGYDHVLWQCQLHLALQFSVVPFPHSESLFQLYFDFSSIAEKDMVSIVSNSCFTSNFCPPPGLPPTVLESTFHIQLLSPHFLVFGF